jgi:Skp family chaperone for outer membrane proteins
MTIGVWGIVFFLITSIIYPIGYDDYFKKESDFYHTRKHKVVSKESIEVKPIVKNTGNLQMGKIGEVDIATLCVIHPLMDYYYLQEKKFVKPYKSNTPGGRDMEFKQRFAEYQAKVKEAHQKIAELKNNIRNLESFKEKLKDKLSSKIMMKRNTLVYRLSKLPVEKRKLYKKAMENSIRKLESKVMQKIQQIDSKIRADAKKYEQYKQIVNSTFYAEGDEERNLINKILQDIITTSKNVAKRYKITYLLNSSNFFMKGVRKEEDQYKLLFEENYDYQIFRSVPAKTLGMKTNKEYYLYRMEHQPVFITPFWETPALRSLLIMGGVDITPVVIKEIFQKYGKSEEEIKAALEAYKSKSNY